MPGIIYVLLIFLLGRELVPKAGRTRLWLFLPASFGLGALAMGWTSYAAAFAAGVCLKWENPLFYGNLVAMAGAGAVLVFRYVCRSKKKAVLPAFTAQEAVFFLFLLAFLTWIMFYVFYIKDGILYSGFTVYGDYAPHTAMMRSFSLGDNFPTQYPHFGGEDVKYHFMFQFLVGNLEYLGIRIDIAYNMLSVFALLGFLMMLYSIARRITGSGAAGVVTVALFFFRSSFTFFRYLWEHLRSGDLLKTLAENTSFIGYTPNEDWGLWNFNVYLNQRHLAFGLLIAALVLWYYLDLVEAGCSHSEKGLAWMKNRLFSAEAWKIRNPEGALAAGLALGLTAFWNGAAVIGGLLILLGFAVFSDGKLDYLVTAVTAVLFSVLQSKVFIRGSAVEADFYWGFISEDKSLAGVLWFLIQMSGIFFAGAVLLLPLLKKRLHRVLTVSCLFPVVFAFCFSLTPDITVNHKYIMISYAFLAVLWAGLLAGLWKGKDGSRRFAAVIRRAAAVLLAVCLTATGIYDFVVILRNNGPGHRVTVNMESTLTDWLAEHLDSEDLLLTPEYSMSETTMSGVMMYLGWPYYAWSAGYDTYGRAQKAVEIYTSEDPAAVDKLVKEEKITYILFEEGMEFEGAVCREDTIRELYTMVYQSDDGRIRIYET
ncbi:MAG TPA: hypothetical protein IAA14_05130 [Candidatus Blautia excrementigallinarum]|nr:hypothetical protein [Candidatus Blautia excrementigallinarum]